MFYTSKEDTLESSLTFGSEAHAFLVEKISNPFEKDGLGFLMSLKMSKMSTEN
jgi:hypothetical protein